MPETPSTMLDLGTALPSFSLPDFNGRIVSDADFKGSKAVSLRSSASIVRS